MNLKRRGAYYLQLSTAAIVALWGLVIFLEKEASRERVVALQGLPAQLFGGVLFAIGAYSMFHLLFRAEKEELGKDGFLEINDFNIEQGEFQIRFEIVDRLIYVSRTHIPAVDYTITIPIGRIAPTDLKIERRGPLRSLASRILRRSPSIRIGRTLATSKDEAFLFGLLESQALNLFNQFTRKKEAIRVKRGVLKLESGELTYTEGPYDENTRLFDPHRGKIDGIASEMVTIIESMKRASNQALLTTPASRRVRA